MHHALVAVAVVAVIGVSLDGAVHASLAGIWWAFAVVLIAAAAAHLLKRERSATALLLLATGLAGLLRSELSDPLLDSRHFLLAGPAARPPLKLSVVDDPETNPHMARFLARAKTDGAGRPLAGLLQVTLLAPGPFRPAYGDILSVREPIVAIESPPLADPASRIRVMLAQGVLGRLELEPDAYKVEERNAGNPIVGVAYGFRHHFAELLTATHEARTAAFLRSVLLGESQTISPSTLADFRTTGTIHILSQSGQHVGILCLVCVFVFRLLPLGRRWGSGMTLGVLFFYALMTGGRPAVLRAAIMAACLVVGQLSGKKSSPFNAIALAALILLAANPADLYSAGFQLSFAATLGILILTPWLMQLLEGLPTYGNSVISASTAAYLGTLPLMAYHFGSVSLIAPLANLFVLPLISIIMPTALFGLLLGALNPQLAYVFAAANYGFVKVLLWGVGAMAQVPHAELDVPAPWPSTIFVYFLVLVVVADFQNIRRLVRRRRPKGELAAASLDWSWILANRPMDPLMGRIEGLLDQQLTQPPGAEQVETVRGQLGEELVSKLDSVTVRYLAFSASQLHDPSIADESAGTIAVAACLMALERELDARVFRFLRVPDEVARSEVARTYRRGHIGRSPRPPHDVLTLPLQSEILWYHLLPTDGSQRSHQAALAAQLKERLSKPSLYLEPPRLPLHLDRMLKKYYQPLCEGERISRARAEAAVREILGEPSHAVLRELVSAGSLAPAE
ncbi:MAG: ComEC/Rec2 family competence protein [Candidatus Wallbacteria bacterium]|nr:ComEC/Rec2 family competence protein [Candidatus Wallbacteria bacterium]